MSRVKAYSLLTDEIIDIGPSTEDIEKLVDTGDMAATGHPNVIVFVEGPALQKWKDAT